MQNKYLAICIFYLHHLQDCKITLNFIAKYKVFTRLKQVQKMCCYTLEALAHIYVDMSKDEPISFIYSSTYCYGKKGKLLKNGYVNEFTLNCGNVHCLNAPIELNTLTMYMIS